MDWTHAMLPTSLVFFILFFLAPFGFAQLSLEDRLFLSLGFALVTLIGSIINVLLGKVFLPKTFNESTWTFGKELIFSVYDLALLGLWNTLFLLIIEKQEESFLQVLWEMEQHTLFIGILPIFALISFKNSQALKKQLANAKAVNESVSSPTSSNETEMITLKAENGKPELQLKVDELLFINSAGNYLDVYYSSGNELQKHLLRNRIKSVMEALPSDQFFQTHKSYIVNTHKVIKAKGNAREMKLILRGTDLEVPVSRTKAEALLAFMNS